jgi:ADP-L-glycero-D-manno-heptose 6-epimerase
MIIVTGGEGFIGKNLIKMLKACGYNDVVSLDIISKSLDDIYEFLFDNSDNIDCVFHLGAISDTTVFDKNMLHIYNVSSSIFMWNFCSLKKIPLIYASSAATYGDGSNGFDDESSIDVLKPLNPYGNSKQEFDMWILKTRSRPPYWYGLKFFNVYGFGEAHKGRMASMVYHSFNQIECTGMIKLFKSHNPNFEDGGQSRDFIYIDDVVNVCINVMKNKPESGIYNVGTGKARSFNDLAKAVFNSLGIQENIIYIDTPIDIRDKYQYFTEANINKLIKSGCSVNFHELEDGILKYINMLKYENS